MLQDLIKRFKLKFFPETKKDFWYNYAAHTSDAGYSVFDKNKKYIDCRKGLVIDFVDGTVWEVTKIRRQAGGDWLYESDCIQCNLKRIK